MATTQRLFLTGHQARLCCLDFGGTGPAILLLHGLAGRDNEWQSTAQWLSEHGHVFALDQRGHGRSDKGLSDYSRAAYVQDVIAVIEQLRLAPVLLIDQSMGGQNAFLVAARSPHLLRALIVVEAGASPNPSAQQLVERWLSSWPLPFPSLADARAFLGGDTLYAHTWIEMLEERNDGYWPIFQPQDMLRSIADQVTADYWAEWETIAYPTLIVGGANSLVPQEDLHKMASRIPHGRYVQIPQAGHDLHLERPDLWQQTAEAFLEEVLGEAGGRSSLA